MVYNCYVERGGVRTKFETVVTESDMQPQFLGGRRQVTKFGGSEIPLN